MNQDDRNEVNNTSLSSRLIASGGMDMLIADLFEIERQEDQDQEVKSLDDV